VGDWHRDVISVVDVLKTAIPNFNALDGNRMLYDRVYYPVEEIGCQNAALFYSGRRSETIGHGLIIIWDIYLYVV